MDANTVESQIVMSHEIYNELILNSRIEPKRLSRIKRHVRKFNKFLQIPHQQQVKLFEKQRSHLIRTTREFYHAYVGQKVYLKYFDESGLPEYIKLSVKRICKVDRTKLILEYTFGNNRVETFQESFENLYMELPKEYNLGYRQWDDSFIEVYSLRDNLGVPAIMENSEECN